MHKAVFFDRDGVINVDHGYVGSIVDFDFVPGVKEALATIKRAGFLTVLVTNQSGIARGFYTEADFFKLSLYMQSILDLHQARFDLIKFCPHHPKAKLEKYRGDCNCRKPKAGMILEAAQELDIDLSQSLLIGDHASDLIAGQNAGISHNILLTNGSDTETLKVPFADKYVDLSTFVASMRNIFKNR